MKSGERKNLKDKFLTWLQYEKGRRPGTIRAYRYELDRFENFLVENAEVPGEINKKNALLSAHKKEVRTFLYSGVKSRGKRARARTLSVLRSFYSYLVREEYIDRDPTAGIDLPKLQVNPPSFLSESEYLKLLSVVREKAPPSLLSRDLAVISLFLGTGIRREELVSLNLEDVDLKKKEIRVIRKGGRRQIIEMGEDTTKALSEYLKDRGNTPGAFFISKVGNRLGRGAVYYLVKKYIYFAELKGSVHSLRHTCFTQMARQGVSMPVIQAIAGHRSSATTSRYLHAADEDRKKAVEVIKLDA